MKQILQEMATTSYDKSLTDAELKNVAAYMRPSPTNFAQDLSPQS